MARTPPRISNGGPTPVKFKGSWHKFNCLLDYAAIIQQEDEREERAAALIARRRLEEERAASLPVLPRNFRNAIDAMDGNNVVLVIEKSLYRTDVARNNGRLAIMFTGILHEFLTETERRSMENGEDMQVTIIEPSLTVRTIAMTQWDMTNKKKKKKSGKTPTSSMYVLKKHWNDVVRDNRLMENDVLQVWSFRAGEELRLALVLARRDPRNSNEED